MTFEKTTITIPKTYVGVGIDTSVSMRCITKAAATDFNCLLDSIRNYSNTEGIDTIISAVTIGDRSTIGVTPFVTNSSINSLRRLNVDDYKAVGSSTPLFAGVGKLIDMLSSAPDADDPNVNFLIMVTTDGDENSSRGEYAPAKVAKRMAALTATGRWTFVFRVPGGNQASFCRQYNIEAGNVAEWVVSAQGLEVSRNVVDQGIGQFYKNKAAGIQGTSKFYTDLSSVTTADVKAALTDISSEVQILAVTDACDIRPFIEATTGKAMVKGTAFYQLTKVERAVQDHKQIAIRDRQSGAVYSGAAARQMLGLPTNGSVRVVPGDHGKFDIFVQSTSINRKLVPNTSVLLWEQAVR